MNTKNYMLSRFSFLFFPVPSICFLFSMMPAYFCCNFFGTTLVVFQFCNNLLSFTTDIRSPAFCLFLWTTLSTFFFERILFGAHCCFGATGLGIPQCIQLLPWLIMCIFIYSTFFFFKTRRRQKECLMTG